MPCVVVGLALLATSAGLVGATTVDTTFDQQEFHVEETPGWMDSLPEPLQPGNYTTSQSLEFFRQSGFVNDRNTAYVLVRGNVTHPETLERTQRAHEHGWASNATLTFGNHSIREVDVSSTPITFNETSPVGVMRAVANENESFNATLAAADTDAVIFGHAGDGNVHVNPLVDVRRTDWRARVRSVLDRTVDLVTELGGTLTGEHGDGRVRAPFLSRIWPEIAVRSFRDTKDALDPAGLLNPGVVLPVPDQDPLEGLGERPATP
jgi:FAD/FMN-containing dehydrogenase